MSQGKSAVPFPAIIPHEDIISPLELARRLKVKPSTISEWMRNKGSARALPYFRVGRFLRFSWREISDWLLAQRERGDRLAHVGGRKPKRTRKVPS